MGNLTMALALILATETSNMDRYAVGDTHLPPGQWAYGRFQMRMPMLRDINKWSGRPSTGRPVYDSRDAMNPEMDVHLAAWWLRRRAGDDATVKIYLTTWNGGRVGRNSKTARDYYRKAMTIQSTRPIHYTKAIAEIRKAGLK